MISSPEVPTMTKGQRAVEAVHVYVKGVRYMVTPPIREHVTRKMQRLQKYLDRLSTIEVELSEEPTREAARRFHVEVTASAQGKTLRVSCSDGEVKAAVDEAVDKLYRQLNRQKERMKAHGRVKLAEATPTLLMEESSELVEPAEQAEVPVLRIETIDAKPQFEDEAVAELEARGKDFYVFLNAQSEQINVIYRDSAGLYALVQPRAS